MKLREIVRISEDKNKTRELEAKRAQLAQIRDRSNPNYGTVTKQIHEYIESNPGCGSGDLTASGFKNGTVGGATKRLERQGKIKIRMLDGKQRFYPGSYLTPTVQVPRVKEILANRPTSANEIEQLAKDYAWDSEGGVTLKGFIAWLKERDNG